MLPRSSSNLLRNWALVMSLMNRVISPLALTAIPPRTVPK